MTEQMHGKLYLLLDSRGELLARGELQNHPDADSLQVRILDGKVTLVLEHEIIQMIGMAPDVAPMQVRIIRHRNDVLLMEKLGELEEDVRQNLRVPTRFESFLYPLTGSWNGRRGVQAVDLSCGGIAFFCGQPLQRGEQAEIVIPITAEPVILRCEILRERPSNEAARTLYAAKFVDLSDDEDMLVREAVFSVQLQTPANSLNRNI